MKKRVLFIGGLTPPRTGRNFSTEEVLGNFTEKFDVELINTSPVSSTGKRSVRVGKALNFYRSLIKSVRADSDFDALYLTLNSEYGLIYDIAFSLVVRNKSPLIFVHHHVYNYIHEVDGKFKLLMKVLGSRTVVHIVACVTMANDLRRVYDFPASATFLTMPPASVRVECENLMSEKDSEHQGRPFAVGMLANQTTSKGFFRFLEVARYAQEKQHDWKFILAGPASENCVQNCLNGKQGVLPDNVEYRGAVYGAQKSAFFKNLDIFMFPSLARQESWGIVLHEALAYGVSVLTFDIACTQYLCGDAGSCLPEKATAMDFYKELEKYYKGRSDAERRKELSDKARLRAEELNVEYSLGLDQLSERIRNSVGSSRVRQKEA